MAYSGERRWRARPGLMCFGWLILRENQQIAKGYGITAHGMNATSNIAEYLGLIDGLEALVDISVNDEPVRVIGDSKVVINQMQGLSRINARQVASLHHRACCLAQLLHMVDWKWYRVNITKPLINLLVTHCVSSVQTLWRSDKPGRQF